MAQYNNSVQFQLISITYYYVHKLKVAVDTVVSAVSCKSRGEEYAFTFSVSGIVVNSGSGL